MLLTRAKKQRIKINGEESRIWCDRYNRACLVRCTSGANVAGQQALASGRVGGRRRRWQGDSTAWLHGRWHYLELGFGGDGGLDLTRASPALSK